MTPPVTLVLRPGLHVVRRDDDHLQVGVDPPWRVVVPDRPDVRRMLGDLVAGRPAAPESPACHRALHALGRAGMLAEPARTGPRAVAVQAAGEAGDEAVRVLRAVGCEVTGSADLALVLATGEVARPDADAHVRDGRAHLLVAGGAQGWTLGPFVEPGASACLRCVDAHRGEHDPRRALVVEQLAGRRAAPDDPALASLAIAWAVRDLVTHLDGGQPSTWSATVELGADLRPHRRTWTRHPHCGCSWSN
jgi:hypothetical protein